MENHEKGQSLIELLIAIAIFVIVVSSFAFFLLDSYAGGRLAEEITVADFLAEEGMEAVRSIRDDSWDSLIAGDHGLAISANTWILQGSQEDLSDQFNKGLRKITIEDIDSERKKITSRITWEFTPDRAQEVCLVTYLTNWQKLSSGVEARRPTAHTDDLDKTTFPTQAYDDNKTTRAFTKYDATGDSIFFHSWETTTNTYTSLSLNYYYSAQSAKDDTYAVAYSTSGCSGIFTDLISPTSAGADNITVSAGLAPDQDLSQLCLKIYTVLNDKRDRKTVYSKDIWTEGIY